MNIYEANRIFIKELIKKEDKKILDWCQGGSCNDTISKKELINYIDKAIEATNMNTTYEVGMRNGMRLIKSFIDDKEPEYERCCQEENKSEPDAVSFKVDGDVVVKYEYIFGPKDGATKYKTKAVMTKEIFQECYEKWIKPQIRIACDCCPKDAYLEDPNFYDTYLSEIRKEVNKCS